MKRVSRRSVSAAALLSLVCLVGCGSKGRQGRSFAIGDYGATGDGVTVNTSAFQQAIQACRQAGGGTVRVPEGRFLTGPIDLASDTTLHLEEGATILFTQSPDDYPVVETRWEGTMVPGRRPLLWAKDCRNVAITGKGTIDGQGASWWKSIQAARAAQRVTGAATSTAPATTTYSLPPGERRRPPLVQFRDCQNVRIEGVTFQNSPFWTVHLLFSDHITMRGVKMLAPEYGPNTDAVDVDSCRQVLIEDCYADVGDDGFTLKSGRNEDGRRINRPTEDVIVRNCTVKHAHGGVVIGSETAGSVRRVRFENCTFEGTDNGVRIKSMRGRGGVVEDVVAENIRMKDVVNAFIITMRYQRSDPEPVSERTPRYRDIHLKNITARDSRRAGIIAGLEEMPVTDVSFENLDITATEGFDFSDARNITFRNVMAVIDTPPALKTSNVEMTSENWDVRVRGESPTTRPGS